MMNTNVILITGSTDGIGKQIAQKLARKGGQVLLHGRNPSKGQGVMEEICQRDRQRPPCNSF